MKKNKIIWVEITQNVTEPECYSAIETKFSMYYKSLCRDICTRSNELRSIHIKNNKKYYIKINNLVINALLLVKNSFIALQSQI